MARRRATSTVTTTQAPSAPRGNAVSHEDEMLKLAGNQMDYDAATSLYTHSLALIKTAIGKA